MSQSSSLSSFPRIWEVPVSLQGKWGSSDGSCSWRVSYVRQLIAFTIEEAVHTALDEHKLYAKDKRPACVEQERVKDITHEHIPFYAIANAGTYLKASPEDWFLHYPRHLVLAHILLKYPQLIPILRTMIMIHRTHIILDNGAYEGHTVSGEDLAKLCDQLHPQVACLPDIPGASWEKSRDLSMDWAGAHLDAARWFIYVPQGNSREDVHKSFEWAINTLDSRKIIIGLGLGRRHWETDDSEKGRIQMTSEILSSLPSDLVKNFYFHVFGAQWQGSRYYADKLQNQCVGIDTAKVWRSADGGATYPTKPLIDTPHDDTLRQATGSVFARSMKSFAAVYHAWINMHHHPKTLSLNPELYVP